MPLEVTYSLPLDVQVPFQEVSAPSTALASPDGRPALFMFIAVFSTTDFRHRRDAVREAWMEEAARRTNVLPRFVLTGEPDILHVRTHVTAAVAGY